MKLSLRGEKPVYLVDTPTQPNEATNKLYVDQSILNHTTNLDLHLTPSQNTLLDNLNVLATQLNYTANVTSDIQSQLNSKLNLTGGTLTGTLFLAGDPTANLQASTKQYVDSKVATTVVNYLLLAGGTLTGPLVLPSDPTANLQASTKQYVDTQASLKVNKAGDTMTGSLTLSGDPTANLHASTKQYVDNGLATKLNSTATAVAATKLATARNINGTLFDGTADITTSKWGTARTVTLGPTGKSIDGSVNVSWTVAELVGYTPLNKAGDTIVGNLIIDTGYGITLSKTPTSATDVVNKSYVDNLIAGREYKDPVTDINLVNDALSSPPSSPVVGDVYIVASNPTGAWSGKAGYATYYNGSSWIFLQSRAVQVGDRFGVALTTSTSVSASLSSYSKKIVTILNATVGSITYTSDVITPGSSTLVFDPDSLHFGETYTYTDEGNWIITNTSVNIAPGAGLSLSGKTLNVNTGAGLTLSGNNITINTSSSNGLSLNAGALGVALADTTLSLSSSGLALSTSLLNSINNSISKVGSTTVSGSVIFASGSTLKYQNTPSASDDVTPKTYVDSQVSLKVNKAGDTMTGALTLSGDPTANLHASTKQYVDNKVSSITVVPTATKLATARNINGTLFDGSSDILITEPTFTGYLSNYSISDANSLSSNAIVFRYLQSNASNNPTPNNNTIISIGYNSINTSQIVSDLSANKWYARVQYSGVWSNWDRILFLSDSSSSTSSNTLVIRDSSGNFSANNITATLLGNSSTTTKLATARNINSTLFDGTADITTSKWGTARTLTLGATGKSVDGSANVSWTVAELVGYTPINKAGDTMTGLLTLSGDPTANLHASTKQYVDNGLATKLNSTATAVAATKLATARNINGTLFDGTADIITAVWGTARTLTLGATGKSVDGGTNVSWTVAELVGYTPINKAGDTMTGLLTLSGDPIANLHASTKQYVDNGLATKLNVSGKAADSSLLNGQPDSYYTNIAARLGYTPINKAGDTMTGLLTLSGDPINALNPATKQYVDNFIQGINVKSSARLATTTTLNVNYNNGTNGVGATLTATSNGALTIDTVTPNVGDTILIKDQSVKLQNGPYKVTQIGDTNTPFILTRLQYTDQNTEIPGSYFFIYDGVANKNTGWVLTVNNPTTFTVGTDDINITQFSGIGSIIAGDGLISNGNIFNVATASATRIVINPDNIDLATTGVATGSYTKVTVDPYGRVTAGNNPTTLSGYGITDAVTTSTFTSSLATKLDSTATAVAANKLATARNINDTPFDGTADITTSKWGTARTITLGPTGKSIDGSANVSWTVAELVGYTPLNKAGDTMTGALTLPSDPTANLHASTKQYVDNLIATKLNISGGSLTGPLTLANDPVNNLDAATKQYVDAAIASLRDDIMSLLTAVISKL